MSAFSPIEAWEVRETFMRSERYRRWAQDFDVMALAKTPPMRPEDWSQEDRDAAVRWSLGVQDEMPEPMREFERQVKARKQ